MHPSQQQILDALAKLGPSKPFVIADKTGIAPANCGYHLRTLLSSGQLKASGTSNDRVYALASQKSGGDAPPQRAKKNGTPRTRPAAAATGFLPAFTADQRLVVIEEDRAARIFSTDETQKLADLLLQHFNA